MIPFFAILAVALGVVGWLYWATIELFLLGMWAWLLVSGGLFLTFGTAPFWLLVIMLSLFVAWCVAEDSRNYESNEMWSGAAVTTVLLFGVLVAIINNNLFSFFGNYPWYITTALILLSFAGYLAAAGGGWSWFKYMRLNRYHTDKINKYKTETLASLRLRHGLNDERAVIAKIQEGRPSQPQNYNQNYGQTSKSEADNRTYEKALRAFEDASNYRTTLKSMFDQAKPGNNMDRIMVWIGLWPWSMLAYVLRDPVKMVYNMMLSVYEGVYNKGVGRLESEFNTAFAVQPEPAREED